MRKALGGWPLAMTGAAVVLVVLVVVLGMASWAVGSGCDVNAGETLLEAVDIGIQGWLNGCVFGPARRTRNGREGAMPTF